MNGIIGTVFAMWLYNNFVGWLTFLGSTLPPIGAIILADYFIIRRRSYKKLEEMKFQNVNAIAIIAWITGVILAKYAPGIAPVNALLGSAIIYVVLSFIKKKIN